MIFSQRALEAAAEALARTFCDHWFGRDGAATKHKMTRDFVNGSDAWKAEAESALSVALAVDGVALVPKEPTEDMLDFGACYEDPDGLYKGHPIFDEGDISRDIYRAMLSAASDGPASALQAWRTIESAPKDGTEIIYLNKFGEIGFCYWSEAGSPFDESLWYDDQADDECCPLYWLPRSHLPPPPAASEGEER